MNKHVLTVLVAIGAVAGSGCGGDQPAGLSTVVKAPAGAAARLGEHLSMALDAEGNPMFAYIFENMDGAGASDDTEVFFVSWDKSQRRWSEPVSVDAVGTFDSAPPLRQVSLARDALTGRLAVAYVVGLNQLSLAQSVDGGRSWTREIVDSAGGAEVANPVLRLRDGQQLLAYVEAESALVYATRDGAQGAFTKSSAPLITGTRGPRLLPLDLQFDADGRPGLAYFLASSTPCCTPPSYNTTLAFWRPGEPAATAIVDSQNTQSDLGSVSLAFEGRRPRVAFHLQRDALMDQRHLSFCAATDEGTKWPAPVQLPVDGTDGTGPYQQLVLSGARATVAAQYAFNASRPGLTVGRCGAPKLFRSDDQKSWTACGAEPTRKLGLAGRFLNALLGPGDKLYVAFQYDAISESGELPQGVTLWREP